LGPGFVPSGDPYPVPGAWLLDPRSPSWSADGERLTFVRGTEILEWTVGGAVRLVYAASGELAALSMIRHDGRSVAVASKAESNLDIFSLPIDPETHLPLGPPLARVQSTAREQHPRFSPDGRHLAFVSWRGGAPDVWLADADGRNPRQLSMFGAADPGLPRWSPDGTQITFDAWTPNDTPHVYVVEMDEGLPRLVTTGSATGWSADGEHLYVTELAGVPTVTRFRLSDGRRQRVFMGVGAQEAADGERILYAKPNEFGIFARALAGDVANNPEQRLVDDYWFPPSAGFQPVEQGIFYVGYTPSGRARALRFFDYAQGTAKDIAPLPPHALVVWGLTVSPDHREVLYAIPEAGADLVLLEF
jgi:dipeptidyl aminopeptidase/acylaminoacyl peptidase